MNLVRSLKIRTHNLAQRIARRCKMTAWNFSGVVEDFFTRSRKDKVTIEFYLIDAFEIFHFLPLYHYFRNAGLDARFVAEPCFTNTSGTWFDYDEACRILKEKGVVYSKRANKNADFAFTTQRADLLKKYSARTKRVNMSYGFSYLRNPICFCVAKDSIEGFDYKLVFGERMKRQSSKYMDVSHIYITGFPKHNAMGHRHYDRSQLLEELGVRTDKKILCYFPTWDEYSSISTYADAINALRDEFFVISKTHHCTARLAEKRGELEQLTACSDILLEGNYDFAQAAMLGDVAIADAKSGAMMEIPYIHTYIGMIALFNEPFSEKNFDPEILEVMRCVFSPSNLRDAVLEVSEKDSFTKNRKKLMKDIYGERDYDYLREISEAFRSVVSRNP